MAVTGIVGEGFYKLRFSFGNVNGRLLCCARVAAMLVISLLAAERASLAQDASAQRSGSVTIQGAVLNSSHSPVSDALVRLERAGSVAGFEAKTDASGAFLISVPLKGSYTAIAEKSGLRSRAVALGILSPKNQARLELVLW